MTLHAADISFHNVSQKMCISATCNVMNCQQMQKQEELHLSLNT